MPVFDWKVSDRFVTAHNEKELAAKNKLKKVKCEAQVLRTGKSGAGEVSCVVGELLATKREPHRGWCRRWGCEFQVWWFIPLAYHR